MEDPAEHLREALEAFRHDEAMERVRRWRGTEGAEREAEVAARHRRLAGTGRIRAALDDASRGGTLDAEDEAALRAHLARAAADIELAPARDHLERLCRTRFALRGKHWRIEPALDALSHDFEERRGEAEAALLELASGAGEALGAARMNADRAGLAVLEGAERAPDAGPAPGALTESAEALLDATDDVADVVRRWLIGQGRSFFDLLPALAFTEASVHVPRRDRFRRLSKSLGALDFEKDLAARVRVGGTHPFPGPRARVVLPRVPGDARIFESQAERGVLSEVAAADAVGRALGHVLAAPALPVEHCRPLAGTVSRAMGVLFAQLLGDRAYLRRTRGFSEADADRFGRAAGASLCLLSRVRAATLLARAASSERSSLAEDGATALERALGVPVPPEVALLVVGTPAAFGPRHRATVMGLAVAWQLRERFDEDWFSNPRAAEPLRAAASRGGRLSIEAFAEELGATPDHGAARLAELFG